VERYAAGTGGLQSCPCLWTERGGKGQEGLAKKGQGTKPREGAVGPSGSGKPHSQGSFEAGSPLREEKRCFTFLRTPSSAFARCSNDPHHGNIGACSKRNRRRALRSPSAGGSSTPQGPYTQRMPIARTHRGGSPPSPTASWRSPSGGLARSRNLSPPG